MGFPPRGALPRGGRSGAPKLIRFPAAVAVRGCREAQRFRNTREPFSFMQHHGKPIERPFVRSGKKMQATFGRGAKGTSIAQRAGMSLMQDPRNPSVEVARGAGVTKTRDPEHFRTSHGTDFGTRDVRMHHPAAVAAEMAEDAADSEERESKADQPVFTAFGDRRGGPKSHYYSLRRQNEDRSDLRQLSGTAYTKKLLATAMPFKDVQSMPAHLRNDLYGHHGQVLCFDAFFKEEVPESAREAYRVRKCRIQYYLDDDTLAIVEPEVRNSGLPQGNFLKRTPVPKAGAAGKLGERLTLNDLNVGRSVTIFGRVYHIVDADRKTREALTERGVEVPHGEEMPEDEFEATLAPEQRMWGKDRYVGVKKTSMKVYMEALRGKEVAATVKRAQFLKHNRRVLSFDAVWDDRASLYGGIYRYVVQYFLEDDTVEIREVHEGNDGREPFPMLLSRQKLPRNYEDEVSKVHGTRYEGLEAAPPGHYITHDDLRVGHTIPVYGRPLLLVNCDPATANWLREVRPAERPAASLLLARSPSLSPFCPLPQQGEEVPEPIEVQEDEHELPKDEAAPYKGGVATFGSAEDSLASTKSLVPQKPKKDLKKLLDNDRKILRYRAHLDTPVPQNAERTFVLSLYLADDSIAVYEPPLRNSGIDGGMFVKRQCLRKANGELYQPSDFEPGNTVVILNYRFIVDEADRYTSGAPFAACPTPRAPCRDRAAFSLITSIGAELLQGRQMGLGADLHLLLTRLWERARFSKYVRKEMFFKLDEDRNGFITVEELREYLSRTSPQPLNNAEVRALHHMHAHTYTACGPVTRPPLTATLACTSRRWPSSAAWTGTATAGWTTTSGATGSIGGRLAGGGAWALHPS